MGTILLGRTGIVLYLSYCFTSAVRVSTFLASQGLTLLKASFNCPSNELLLERSLFSSHLYVPCTLALGSNRVSKGRGIEIRS